MSGDLRIGSLCSGYGGLDMGVQRVLGGSVAWHSDIDPGAQRILAHHWPDTPNIGDLTAVDWAAVEPIDLLTGGYPCQPFSTAGRRRGTTDDRHIWPYIAHALGVLRPRFALFENVGGHLSLGFDTVLADLARLGWDAEWVCVRASDVGAAHQRRRLFILAWPAADADGDVRAGRDHARAVARPAGQDACAARGFERHGVAARSGGAAAADAHGDGGERARTHVAGRPQPADHGQPATDPEGQRREQGEPEPARQQGGSDSRVGGVPDWGAYSAAVAAWESLTRPAPRPTDDRGRLSPAFVEWLMGLPEHHVTGVPDLSRAAQLHALGNGVVPQQAAHALRLLLDRAAPALPPG
ncbi:DNA cytosine methyltransferase [Kitasatospora sp. MMS16-BH015]|uniref:DNA cytosine methyltransferase n=1 Tax=Kitasatospora sp. MMS16-BH015 TaxID=2018025 RepID=UPI000CF23736|nr:DNA cytosine methyltransferase [Kitasatospora sp. MMS16-BH015]